MTELAYAVQAKTDLKSIVWYNTQVFADGGYAIPTTLDELFALSNQMIADGQTPWCIGIESGPATGWTFTDWMEDMMLRIEGPDAYDEWTSNVLKFDDPRVIAVGRNDPRHLEHARQHVCSRWLDCSYCT